MERSVSSQPSRDEEKTAGTSRIPLSVVGAFIGFIAMVGLVYYFLIWKRQTYLPWHKWLIAIGVLSLLGLLYAALKNRNRKPVIVAGNFLIVLLIIFGATVISIGFKKEAQYFIFKLFFVAYFSFLPPWLYLQFISTRGRTKWADYVLNLYRLHIDSFSSLPDPPRNSIFYEKKAAETPIGMAKEGDVKGTSLYQKKFEGMHGSKSAEETFSLLSFRGENLLPVAVATVLISVGWVFAIQPESIFFVSLPEGIQVIVQGPYLEGLRLAFLGAYFYVLQMLVRRYFQNDLRTSAYVHSIMRIIIAAILSWVIVATAGGRLTDPLRGLVFVVGVFPDVGWQAIQASIKRALKKVVIPRLEAHPLNNLAGLTIWDESRLLEEGIEDLQNLATANIVDLMLNTRIPIERLIDWIDQALLYIHLEKGESDAGETSRKKLRRFGIRAASDLAIVLETLDAESVRKLESILDKDQKEPSCLRSIYTIIKGEPNFFHVREWKANSIPASNQKRR